MFNNAAPCHLDVQLGLCPTGDAQHGQYAGAYLGTAEERARFGIVAALADGVGGASASRVAAELAVRMFVDGYLGQSDTLAVCQVGGRSLDAVNRWIHAQRQSDPALSRVAVTFVGLILRGRQAHLLHVGDARVYRLRAGDLSALTQGQTERRRVPVRALGPEPAVQIDYACNEAEVDDRYLLCSSGVHDALGHRRLGDALASRVTAEEVARRIVETARAEGNGCSLAALVVDIVDLPAPNLADLQLASASWPIIPLPRAGAVVDEFVLEEVLADGRYSRVFRALDRVEERPVIVKFPKPAVAQSPPLRQAFLRETWIAGRVRSPWIGATVEVAQARRSCLYVVLPRYAGETLEQRLARAPAVSLARGLQIALKLAKAVAALHRAGIIHRDIKPENVILHEGDGVKLIDLGVARILGREDIPEAAPSPGTPSYMAPELLAGAAADEQSDLFALGVTVYRMFTRAYPYGEIEPFSRPRFGPPAALAKWRADLPSWLDPVLRRAYAARTADRFGDVLEFIFEIEHGAERGRPTVPIRQPLYHRNPVRFLQILSAALALALVVALAVLSARR